MNEQERQELEQLKTRQAELRAQLGELGQKLEAFERRLAAPAPAVPVPEPKPEPIVRPAIPPLPPRAPIPAAQSIPPIQPPLVARPVPPRETQPQPVMQTAASAIAPVPPPRITEQPAPSREEPKPKKGSLEMRVGTFWLVRIGIVMLLTSLVFFGTYAYQNFIPRLGAPGKVALLYLASAALLGIGAWLQRKQESLKNYGQVLQAGGLAAVYFTTYAAHHFPNLEIIRSAVLDGVLLLGWAGFIIWLADRKKSEVLALFAVLLAYYTSVITHAGLFTLFSNLVLTGAAVFFLVRNRWATLSFASLAATYVSYAFWRFFDAGQWHWADPAQGLWTGNYFLMGYWLLFTAAVFLSRHEKFIGERRAAFLTLNNGAFFSAFLLTMLQVHQGGFWKFSLGYGIVLLALAWAARAWLAQDRLAGNAYLTQGLLLVTLGFVTHLAGLQLGLVLAVESVTLLMAGQLLKSRVMQAGSIITAALAAGWTIAAMKPFDRHGLIAAVAVGGMMIWNAFTLRRRTTFEQSAAHPRTLVYTSLGLAVWLYATWKNCPMEWLGLTVACESTALLLAARPLGNQVLRFGSALFAAVVLLCELHLLGNEFGRLRFNEDPGLVQGVITMVLMFFNSIWEQRSFASADKKAFSPGVVFFSLVGALTCLLTTAAFTPTEYLAAVLAVEALLLTAACYPLRLKELILYGQLFLLLSQVIWLQQATSHMVALPWWNPVIIIAITLVLAAWWQRQKTLVLAEPLALLLQGLHALAVVGVLFFWLEPRFSAPTWLAFTSVLAILLTIYAALNRFWLLAAAGQIFMVVSIWQFGTQLVGGEPEWYLAIVPIAALCLLSFSAVKWFETHAEANPEVRYPVLSISLIYRIGALIMSLWWVQHYVPAREQIWVLTAIGLALFLLSGWRRKTELLYFGAAFTLVGLIKFWLPFNEIPKVYWPNLLAILALLAQQQFAQRARERYPLSKQIHAPIIVVGGLSLWLLVSRWIMQQTSGFYLTVGWSAVALVLFIVGMATKERVYRWLGLAVLACAMGRVVIFDVWKLETLYRIFTFMALGLVLLILGFIYNKYQEKIKEWL